jgi:hypothetical protein
MATTAAGAGELKQQAAFEASRDPNSSVGAEDAVAEAELQTKEAGVLAHTFDPDASPEEKAAQARSVRPQRRIDLDGIVANVNVIPKHIPEGFHRTPKPKGTAIATDIDDGCPGAYDLPPPLTIETTASGELTKDGDGGLLSNGSLSKTDEEWWVQRTGWAPRFGSGDPNDGEGATVVDSATWVDEKIDDKFYGG